MEHKQDQSSAGNATMDGGAALSWRERLALMVPWIVVLLAGMREATLKWRAGKPEWAYYVEFVREPLAIATGPDEKVFGYLPGAKLLLAPFVWAGPAGFFVFLVLSTLALLGTHRFMADRFLAPAPDVRTTRWRVLWLSLCLAGPGYMALQNNQVVTFCVLLVLLGMGCVRRRFEFTAGCLLGIAILIKTLPLATLALPFVLGRYRAPVYAVLVGVGASVLFACLTDGMTSSLFHHLAWPGQISEQDPLGVFRGNIPESFDSNQSALAYCTRFAEWVSVPFLAYAPVVCSMGAFVLLAWGTLRLRADERRETFWLLVASWLAWVCFAAPFGRYYYVLFCAPLWYLAGTNSPLARSRAWWLVCLLPVSPFVMGGHNPAFAIVCFATVVLACHMVWHLPVQAIQRAPRIALPMRHQLVAVARLATAGVAVLVVVGLALSVSRRSEAKVLDEVSAGLETRVRKDGGDLIVVASLETYRDSGVDSLALAKQITEEDLLLVELRDLELDTYIVPYASIHRFESLKSRWPIRRVRANEGFVVYRERGRN